MCVAEPAGSRTGEERSRGAGLALLVAALCDWRCCRHCRRNPNGKAAPDVRDGLAGAGGMVDEFRTRC